MQVAAWRQLASIEIGVGVEPQNPQRFALFATVASHGTDRTNTQAVVSSEQNGQAFIFSSAVHGVMHLPVPFHDFGKMPIAIDRRLPGIGWSLQISPVIHHQTATYERTVQAGHT